MPTESIVLLLALIGHLLSGKLIRSSMITGFKEIKEDTGLSLTSIRTREDENKLYKELNKRYPHIISLIIFKWVCITIQISILLFIFVRLSL